MDWVILSRVHIGWKKGRELKMKPQGKLKMQRETMNFLRSKQNIGNQNSTYLVYGVKYQRKINWGKKKEEYGYIWQLKLNDLSNKLLILNSSWFLL